MLAELFLIVYRELNAKSFFDQNFGFECISGGGQINGLVGGEIAQYIFRKLRKRAIWPIEEHYEKYSEDDIFDMIEFLYDHVSKPTKGSFDSDNDCGMHYYEFDVDEGRKSYREDINEILGGYEDGYTLDEQGEILALGDKGFTQLFVSSLPKYKTGDVNEIAERAIRKFRQQRSSVSDKRDAVHDLADAFESIKGDVAKVLNSKDEDAIFTIANKFAIRHYDQKQLREYDQDIWLNWMFYFYLATLHASIRLLNRKNSKAALASAAPQIQDNLAWNRIIKRVRLSNNSLGALMGMYNVEISENTITILSRFNFHRDLFLKPINQKLINEAIFAELGAGWSYKSKTQERVVKETPEEV